MEHSVILPADRLSQAPDWDRVPRVDAAASGAAASSPPRIVAIGTATPATSYCQAELLEILEIKDRRLRSVFLNSAIERRYLTLPPVLSDGTRQAETQADLLRKHRRCAVEIGGRAIRTCIEALGVALTDISYLCCVTTTGFLSPGISAFLSLELGLPTSCARLDVVGMGCHGGLNGLNAVASWATANPGKLAVMLCVEICSAGYVLDDSIQSTVVNSLFGDGAAAVAVVAGNETETRLSPAVSPAPRITAFHSRIITDAIDAMRYIWSEQHGKFSFFLDPEIPYVVGAHAPIIIDELLSMAGLRKSDLRHWLVHSGGKKVIDSVRVNLGLSAFDLRHTTSILRDYGNLSSGSFLFSYQRLLEERVIEPGDHGVMMTMGPGSTIEAALLNW